MKIKENRYSGTILPSWISDINTFGEAYKAPEKKKSSDEKYNVFQLGKP